MSLFNLFETIVKKLNGSVKVERNFEDIIWDSNTEGLETFSVDIAAGFTLHCYLVSEEVITKEQILGATFNWVENGNREAIIAENMSGMAKVSFTENGSTYETKEARFACITEDNTELDYSSTLGTTVVYPKAGVWLNMGESVNGIFFTANSLISPQGLIDEECLPDIFVKSSEKATANGVATLDSDGKIPVEQIPDDIGGSEQIQADYEQNDETAVDYIKNRPFYQAVEPVIFYEGEYTTSYDSSFGVYAYTARFNDTIANHPPETIDVTLDGVEYNDLGVSNVPGLGYCCGNLSMLNALFGTSYEDTGEPFFIGLYNNRALIATDPTQITTHMAVIKVPCEVTHKMSEDFLPEGIGFLKKGTGENAEIFNDEANIASGDYSHAEGSNTTASGYASHAEGEDTTASDDMSHAEGRGTVAASSCQHAQGKFNIPDPDGVYAHIVGNGLAGEGGGINIHTLDWQGNAMFKGTVSGTGADYAEFFEWVDGNPDKEDRIGLLVAFEGEKIRLAQADDKILGIVSGTAMVLGDNAEWEWQGKYLTDNFGRVIYEMVEEFIEVVNPETGKFEKKSVGFFPHGKINPEWDSSQTYVSRINRPEWATIGLMGKIHALDDGSCVVGGYATIGENGIATASESSTNMYVMKRITDNIVLLFVKAPEW